MWETALEFDLDESGGLGVGDIPGRAVCSKLRDARDGYREEEGWDEGLTDGKKGVGTVGSLVEP